MDGRSPTASIVTTRTGDRPTAAPLAEPTHHADLDDRAIVEAVLAGDREAFRVLVDREGAAVVRACHRILGDLHEAEDAAQEAFVTAFRSLAGWRGDGPFGAWLTADRGPDRAPPGRSAAATSPGSIRPTRPARLDLPGGAGSGRRPRSAPSGPPRSGPPSPGSTSRTARSSRCGSSAS